MWDADLISGSGSALVAKYHLPIPTSAGEQCQGPVGREQAWRIQVLKQHPQDRMMERHNAPSSLEASSPIPSPQAFLNPHGRGSYGWKISLCISKAERELPGLQEKVLFLWVASLGFQGLMVKEQ